MLSLLLLQHALAPTTIDARSRLPSNPAGNLPADTDSRPYLKIAGGLPLRFADAVPPPDLTVKPAAGAPPQPTPAASTPTVTGLGPVDAIIDAAHKQPEAGRNDPPAPLPTPTSTNPPPPILPDDTHPATRPEDFLPFFQFPGGPGGGTVVVPVSATRPPAPGQQPSSSATYQQK